jgi:hypothetical protein
MGIIRNRSDRLLQLKRETQRRKNRFQLVGKEEPEDNNSSSWPT